MTFEELKALGARATLSRKKEDLSQALEAIRGAQEPGALIKLGHDFFIEPELSLPALRRALELDPRSTPAMSLLGLVLSQFGDDDEARIWLERAKQIAPGTVEVLQLEAALELEWVRSRPLYEAILKLDPNHAVAKANLAMRGGPEPIYFRAKGAPPPEPLTALALQALESKDAADHVKVLEAIGRERDPVELIRFGEEFLRTIRYSVPAFQRALELDPSRWEAMASIGMAYYLRGEDEQAADWYARVKKVAPEETPVLELQAAMESDPSRRRALYEAILKKEPSNKAARSNLGLP